MKVDRAWRWATGLSLFTIVANLVEGTASTILGLRDETLALFGFGVDSFIEVVSAVGVAHMVRRVRSSPGSARDGFERTALRITGTSFHLLALALLVTAAANLATGHGPESTFWGTVVALVSLSVMIFLMRAKERVGRELGSAAIMADAACTRACIAMSAVLLASSAIHQAVGIPWLDSLGAVGIAYYSWREGHEALEKARGGTCSCEGACR
jgi:hypothetical protein